MKLENSENPVGPYRYRRPRKRPLVGPTGSPFLDSTLELQTRSCRWYGRKVTMNPAKKVTFRDEAIISMSVAGEVTDSSIMEVGRSRPQFQYSREELMEIKILPLAKRRPDYLDVAYNNSRGVWDPERWHMDRKCSASPTSADRMRPSRAEEVPEPPGNKRRSGDPRERIRKEQDGIVLSPQRRSFNSGCFVNVAEPPPRRPQSPIGGKPEVIHREPVRRIGSGRLLNREMWDEGWDPKGMFMKTEKLEPERSEFAFRTSTSAVSRERDTREVGRDREPMRDRENVRERDDRGDRGERYERRSFGRDFGERDREMTRDRGPSERNERGAHPMDRGRDRRYGNDRRRTYGEPEEPEWFSGGPTSQHDTIELRGFDDPPEEKNNAKGKKASPAQKKRGKKIGADKDERQSGDSSAGPKGRSTPTAMDQPMNAVHAPHSPISEQIEEEQAPNGKERSDISDSATTEPSELTEPSSDGGKSRDDHPPDFNLDDFLKSDTFPGVPGLLTNGVGAAPGSGSRFSQWFKRESPVQQLESRRASIQDELLNNLLNDITEPNIQIPSVTESNAYFAPISPANTTNTDNHPHTGVKLLEMLQRNNKPNQNGQGDAASTVIPMMKNSTIKDMEVGGKVVHSLEELEARMRGAPAAPSNEPPRVNKTEEDLSAFKKLLAQVTGGQAVPATNGPISQKEQPMTLLQLLNNQLTAQQQQQQQPPVPKPMHPPSFNHVGPLGPAQHPHQAQMQHENLMKVLRIQQQQQQQQQKQRQQQQSDMLSMMMSGQQRMVGVSPVPQDMQMLVNNAASSRELLQRPEAQAIIQGLQQGEITRQHLIQQLQIQGRQQDEFTRQHFIRQLQNPAMQHRHREVISNILKMYGGTTPRNVSPHGGPGAPHDLQQFIYQHQQHQQQQQQQQRIPSPMNNVIPHRVPSPRGLSMHTQTIMQNALIKKKLEEQRENFRKRQEQQQQQQKQQQPQMAPQQQISSPVNSPSKQTLSPTPLAFTPTSVLRKMTAEKELEGSSEPAKLAAQNQQAVDIQNMQSAVQLIAQGVLSRHKASMGHQANQAQVQAQAQASWASPSVKQHPGRPIVKGGSVSQFQYGGPGNFPQQPPQQPQQPQPPQRPTPAVYGNPARSKHTMATPMPHPNVSPYNVAPNSVMNQRPNIMNNQMKVQQVQSHLAPMQQQRNSQVQLVMNQNNAARTDARLMRSQHINMTVGRQASPGSNGGSLSPTSNQLARWFSPELLAKARAGKLPELGQSNVLSLEELERLQYASTTVHN